MADFGASRPAQSAAKVGGIYLAVSVIWILGSDRLVEQLSTTGLPLTTMQTYKGLFFVFASALLLFEIVRRDVARLVEAAARLARSEAELRGIFEGAPIGMAVLRGDRCLRANPALRRMLGLDPSAEAGDLDLLACLSETDRRRLAYDENAAAGAYEPVEIEATRPDGEALAIECSAVELQTEDGRAAVVMATDITPRRRAEAARREMEDRYRRLFDTAPVGIMLFRDGKAIDANSQFIEMFGYADASQVIGLDLWQFVHPSDRARVYANHVRRRRGEPSLDDYESLSQRSDGTPLPTRVQVGASEASGDPFTTIYLSDLTATKAGEAERAAALARFQTVFDDSPVAMHLSREGTIIAANAACARLYGYDGPEDLVGVATGALVASSHTARQAGDSPPPAGLTGGPSDELGARRDGSVFAARVRAGRIELPEGEAVLTNVADVSEQKAAENALRSSERTLQAVFNATFEFMALVDPSGSTIGINAAALDFLGLEYGARVEGPIWELPWPPSAQEAVTWLRDGVGWAADGQFVRDVVEFEHPVRGTVALDVSLQPLNDEGGQVTGLIIEGRDITGLRVALRRAETLAGWLQATIEAADELLGCGSIDEACRRAVELARHRLGLERCAIYLREGDHYRGTFGTGLDGTTTDERHVVGHNIDPLELGTESSSPRGLQWFLRHGEVVDRPQSPQQTSKPGWYAVTPIRASGHNIGLFYNDTGISETPVEPDQQDQVCLFCRVLGSILDRLRLRVDVERAKGMLEATQAALAETVCVVDPRTARILAANPAAERMLGWPPSELVGQPADLLHLSQEAWREHADHVAVALTAEGIYLGDATLRHRDGHAILTELQVAPLQPESGWEQGIVCVVRDVTAQRRMEGQLREANTRLEALLRANPAALVLVTGDLEVTFWSDSAEALFGWSASEVLGQAMPLVPTDRLGELRAALGAAVSSGGGEGCEVALWHRDGTGLNALVFATDLLLEPNLPPGYAAAFIDISAQKRLERELHENRERLRTASLERELIEEQQRRTIAVEIHDVAGQELTLLKLQMAALTASARAGGATDELAECQQTVDRVIRHLRGLVTELSPPILYELGLGPALTWLGEQFDQAYSLAVQVEVAERPVPEAVGVLLFRIARELLLNVVKHAQVDRARISLITDPDQVILAIQDEGVGFEARNLEGDGVQYAGLGLFSVRERVAAIGGRVVVRSSAGAGCRVEVVVPMPQTR